MLALAERIRKKIVAILCWTLSFIIKKDCKKIAIGSWNGQLYADNSRYLLEEMLKQLDSSYTFFWIGEREFLADMPKDERICVLKKDTLSTILKLMSCKYFFCSQLIMVDICNYNIYHGGTLVLLYHGFPIKKIGGDKIGEKRPKKRTYLRRVNQCFRVTYNYFLASSKLHEKILLSAFSDIGCNNNTVLRTGTPRNDFLLSLSDADKQELSAKYKRLFNISLEKKLVLYMPTFRRSAKHNESLFYRRNADEHQRLIDILSKYDYVLIEKAHFAEGCLVKEKSLHYEEKNYVYVNKKVDPQELLAAADVLITDYSSCFVDYLLLDRPIIHYLYDYDFFKNVDSGLYFSKDEFACGEIASDYDQLLDALECVLAGKDSFQNHRKMMRKRFLEYETGNASNSIINEIIDNNF